METAADGKSFDLTLPALEAGESYTISGLISKSGEWHTDHTITWTVKLNQNNADLTGTVLLALGGALVLAGLVLTRRKNRR